MLENLQLVKDMAAGLAGSLVAVVVSPPARKLDAFAEIAAGFLASIYLTEPVYEWIGFIHSQNAVAFLVGLFGMAGIRVGFDAVRSGAFLKLFGKGKS